MKKSIDIELLELRSHLDIRQRNDKQFVFDPIRKKLIILQPEELVRQLFLEYLIRIKKYPKNFLKVETGISVNKLQKRVDILAYDKQMNPFLLVECKAFNVDIKTETFEQISRYNISLSAPYLVVSNGIQHFCSLIDLKSENYSFAASIPDYPE